METLPTEEEVLEYFTTLSNWGRWGNDDQIGTLKLANTTGSPVNPIAIF